MKFSYIFALPMAMAATILTAPDGADIIPDSYIVVMGESTPLSLLTSTITAVTGLLGVEPKATYNVGSFKGFSVSASDSLINTIAALVGVSYVEPDAWFRTQAFVKQIDPPYGLARISHRQLRKPNYVYDDSAGEGTYVYGIDTGIYCGHNDFKGRCTFGANFAGDNDNTDGNGHGTHTAGTFGGTMYGVAKNTSIIAVKVLDASGSGTTSGVLEGIQWAVNDMRSKGAVNKAVANLSLGGYRGSATNQAAAAAVKAGLFMAVAAGNDMAPAEAFSPASEPTVCTVAASDKNDEFAYFSNYGDLVDVIAPGVDVLSAWIGGPDDTNTISGTSMATPHVAGLAAYLIALEGPRKPQALCNRIRALSTKGKVIGAQTAVTDNYLAFNGKKSEDGRLIQ